MAESSPSSATLNAERPRPARRAPLVVRCALTILHLATLVAILVYISPITQLEVETEDVWNSNTTLNSLAFLIWEVVQVWILLALLADIIAVAGFVADLRGKNGRILYRSYTAFRVFGALLHIALMGYLISVHEVVVKHREVHPQFTADVYTTHVYDPSIIQWVLCGELLLSIPLIFVLVTLAMSPRRTPDEPLKESDSPDR